jgi:hypothetical protein
MIDDVDCSLRFYTRCICLIILLFNGTGSVKIGDWGHQNDCIVMQMSIVLGSKTQSFNSSTSTDFISFLLSLIFGSVLHLPLG